MFYHNFKIDIKIIYDSDVEINRCETSINIQVVAQIIKIHSLRSVTKAIVISGSSCFIYAPDSRPPPEHGDLITAGVRDNNGHNLRRGYI